jgi:drug/metabolite transporter (DMT)-like permease
MAKGSLRAYLVLPLGAVAVSFASIFIRLSEAPPLVIAAYRLSGAALILLPFNLSNGFRGIAGLGRMDLLYCLLAGIALSLHFALWITSLSYTSVASSLVLVTTNPIFVGLFSYVFLKEKIGRNLIIGIILSVVGGVLISIGDLGGRSTLYGDLLALLGGVMMSVYLLLGRRVRRKTDLVSYVTVVYGIAALILVVVVWVSGESFYPYPPQSYLMFGLLALVPQLIGHTSFNWALRFFPPSFVAVVILAEPVGSTILAYFLLREGITHLRAVGGVLILSGIYISARGSGDLNKQTDET